jgi:hypothetical protein
MHSILRAWLALVVLALPAVAHADPTWGRPAGVTEARTVSTTSPLGGGGALSSDLTLTCATCTTSTSAFGTDNVLVRSDGTGRGTQATGIVVDDSNLMGLGLTPTHALTLPAASTGIAIYNVAGAGRMVGAYASNIFTWGTEANGGSNTSFVLKSGNATSITLATTGVLTLAPGIGSTAGAALDITNGGVSFSSTSNAQYHVRLISTWNQASGSGSGDELLINPTFTACGSGGCTFVRGVDNTTERFRINSAGTPTFAASTAPPASGSTVACIKLSSTANLGFCVGDGAPTFSAAKGTVYSNTGASASSSSTRLYVNTDGGTTWTSITTGS